MAIFYSDQEVVSVPEVRNSPRTWGGEVRVAWFSATLDAAQNDVLVLTHVPVGSRILRGRIDFTDFGTSVVADIGPESSPALFASDLDIAAAAGQADLANTAALGMGYLAVAGSATLYNRPDANIERILLTFQAANPVSGTVSGYFLYVHQ